jgi:transcriptional regulator with XRE-family HTH domain
MERTVNDDGVRSPTAVRRALGQRLRELRAAAGFTVEQASELVGISQPKLTKIERAQVAAAREDVLRLLATYGRSGATEQEQLLAMARDGNNKEWWEGRDLRLLPKLGSYLGLEAVATALQAYDTSLVHGLLQTSDYAHALIRGGRPDLLDHEVDQLVQTRMRRQEVINRADPTPLTLWWIMDDAVLRRQIGGRQTMHAQLEHLIQVGEKPNVNLLVLPDSMGAHPALDGPFAILQFEDGARPVVYVEGQAGNLYMEKDHDLRRCRQIMHHLLAAAPGPESSMDLIRQASEEMKP